MSRRTVFRDLGVLREAGLPLEHNESSGSYRLNGGNVLPSTNFTTQEALAMIVLCHELGDGKGLPFYGAARRAAAKIESSLPLKLRDELRGVTGAVHIRLPPANPLDVAEANYERLLDAVRERRCVRIRYDAFSEGQQITTKLSPYQLLFSRRSWYVIGRSSLHRSVRTFNVGRILAMESTGDRFAAPRRFSLSRYLRNAWHLIPEPGPDREVTIRFQPLVARNVAEVMWHKTQRHTLNSDGTLDFHVTVSGLNEISWWILGYGDQAEVIEPSELRQLVMDRCARMVETYRADGTVPPPDGKAQKDSMARQQSRSRQSRRRC